MFATAQELRQAYWDEGLTLVDLGARYWLDLCVEESRQLAVWFYEDSEGICCDHKYDQACPLLRGAQ